MNDSIIEGVTALVGQNLEVMEKAFIRINDGRFTDVREGNPQNRSRCVRYKWKDMVAIPGLIDAHTHLGDSFAKDVGIGSSLKELFRPKTGLKHKLLDSVPESLILKSMRDSALDMLRCGVTTFADFREGGKKGVVLLKSALKGVKIRAIILGRPDYYFSEEEVVTDSPMPDEKVREVEEVLKICDGLGLSGPNEYTDRSMKEISRLVRGRKIFAIHTCEDRYSMNFSMRNFHRSEVERALKNIDLDFLVHLTQAREEDIELVSNAKIPVVCCPRANSILGLGIPPISSMIKSGITVALGTDNVMLNSTDLFREMDYTSRILRALERESSTVSSKDIMKMVTINAAKALKLDKEIGSIEEGKRADAVFINMNTKNLKSAKDPINSIVHRVRPDDIQAVMVGGEIVYGSLQESE
ncbi:MAG: amidohydrolase family protein [Candidatus Methylarchaceae archaeon HK01M]|nr:amidohydrolase family protein [Candidatus Methylarchaceae archaeon HK01M]